MKSQLIGLLLIALCVVVPVAKADTEYPEEDDVVVLKDDTFDSFLTTKEFVLAEFYAPWCGHCKHLAPEYAKAAKRLKDIAPNCALAKIDATENQALAGKFDVRGYPTLKFFTGGKPTEYNGGRTEKDIVDWVKKKLLPPSSEVNTVDSAEKLINDNEVAVIYFGEQGHPAHEAFIGAARAYDDISFAHTGEHSVASKYGFEDVSSPKIVLFKKFDEGRADFDGKTFTTDAIKQFIDKNQFATIMTFDQKAAQKIFGEGHAALFLFHEGGDAGNKAHEALKEAAQALKGKILISVSGVRDGLPKRLAEYVGVAEKDIPNVRIVDTSSEEMPKFVLQGDITADAIIQFYEDFVNKRLKASYKSEEIPESNDEPVKVIVGKNFDAIVMDESKDVLLELYAPWCGHCKSLAPIYDKLAQRLSHIPNLVIAKMDATANEVEGIKVGGFPTIKFFPTNRKKNPVDFNGDRTEEGFLAFLKESMTVPYIDGGSGKSEDL